MEHIQGRKFCDADCVSRIYEGSEEPVNVLQMEDLQDAQNRDTYCSTLEEGNEFIKRNGLWMKKNLKSAKSHFLVIAPISLRRRIVSYAHDSSLSGHVGYDKTLARVEEEFWWPGLKKAVKDYVSSCDICQKNNYSRKTLRAPMQVLPLAEVFQRIFVDFVVCTPASSGCKFILTIICATSKYLIAIPMKEISALETARVFIDKVILIHGAPIEVYSDRGTN